MINSTTFTFTYILFFNIFNFFTWCIFTEFHWNSLLFHHISFSANGMKIVKVIIVDKHCILVDT
jgi:hypothetical protein